MASCPLLSVMQVCFLSLSPDRRLPAVPVPKGLRRFESGHWSKSWKRSGESDAKHGDWPFGFAAVWTSGTDK